MNWDNESSADTAGVAPRHAPDGTVTTVESVDKDALSAAQATAILLAERNSGK